MSKGRRKGSGSGSGTGRSRVRVRAEGADADRNRLAARLADAPWVPEEGGDFWMAALLRVVQGCLAVLGLSALSLERASRRGTVVFKSTLALLATNSLVAASSPPPQPLYAVRSAA